MSSNRTYTCYKCLKMIKKVKEELKEKLSKKEYDKLKDTDDISELFEYFPEEYIQGDSERIEGCDCDGDYFEDWGEGVYIDEDGNLVFSISGTCDLCGSSFNYEIKLPENGDTNKKIDLTKKEVKE